ncbi:MAG TPA: maleylpyruvate isomerase family mycothiol-dependent enzyme [Acidimicrobiia bacterium]|jgi:uncharacterized protein (TIGR03083 family)|nr:maleylpyruvate isomerase family mycothiol-dependent enzyme [Acidimicrobiia bacterium]
MPRSQPAEPLDVSPVLRAERDAFVALLEDLSPEDWSRPTECPAWTVQGIALHVLGDDLSLLARQRDAALPAVFRNDVGAWAGDYRSLDDFNEHWVETAQFFSPRLIVEALRVTGDWTLRWYTAVDPTSVGEAVAFVSDDPAPYWMIAAREYLERWIHQLQVRRAVDRPGLDEPGFVVPAVATLTRGFPRAFRALPFADGTAVELVIDDPEGASWTVRRDGGDWTLHDGAVGVPTIRLTLDAGSAALLFSRALTPAAARGRVAAEGEPEVAEAVVAGLAAFFGQNR